MPSVFSCFKQALSECRGDHLVATFFSQADYLSLLDQPWYAIAVGKASVAMMQGVLSIGSPHLVSGLVISPTDFAAEIQDARVIQVFGSHPIPDQHSIEAGKALLSFVQALPETARVMFFLSGGASALVEVLPNELSLTDVQGLTQDWLASGMNILQINQARKETSLIKGGKLLSFFPSSASIYQFILSDVSHGQLESVGSGLLFAPSAKQAVHHVCLADNQSLLEAVARCLPLAQVMPDYVTQDVYQLSRHIASYAKPNTIRIWGGEPVVVLPANSPKGGRMLHLALAVAWALIDVDFPWSFMAVASDGRDGTSGVAGALVNEQTIVQAQQLGWCVESALLQANAFEVLNSVGATLQTGYTGTNLNDVMVLVGAYDYE